MARQDPTWAAATSASGHEPIPAAIGKKFAVAAGHEAGAEAALEVWERTGNAVDAAVAATLALGVVEPHLFGLGGEVSGLVHIEGTTRALAGATRAPAQMNIGAFDRLGIELVPGDGLLAAGPPAVLTALLLMLKDHGTAPFSLVASPAIALAEDGFEIGGGLARAIRAHEKDFRELWPESAAIWMPEGTPANVGERIRQPALAETLRRLAAAGDDGGLDALQSELRKGFVAQAILDFASEPHSSSVGSHASFLAPSDLAEFEVRWEKPAVWRDRHGRTICKCGPWSQGPILLQQLALMEAGGWDDLAPYDADLLHATTETLKLAFADREGYFGDPDFVDVPLEALLEREYLKERARLVDMKNAGDPRPGLPRPSLTPWWGQAPAPISSGGDTTHLDVADGVGTLISLTPSGGWFSSPVVPELGFPLGTRCQTFWLDPSHPNALQPGKRPRTTLTPTIVLENGSPRYALGTPGGDTQDQIQSQMLHGLAQGLPPEEVVDMPTVVTKHHHSSFFPHGYEPGVLQAESRLPREALEDLASRGHELRDSGEWGHGRPQVLAITSTGELRAAASRRIGTAGVGAR